MGLTWVDEAERRGPVIDLREGAHATIDIRSTASRPRGPGRDEPGTWSLHVRVGAVRCTIEVTRGRARRASPDSHPVRSKT